MGKTNFTKRALEKLEAAPKRYNIFDSQTNGLGIVVYPSGQKTFFHLRKVQGWPERTTLGTFPDLSVENARGKASELNGKLARWKANDYEGPSPLERRHRGLAFGQLVDDYIERHVQTTAKNPDRAARELRKAVDRYVPSWRARNLGAIRRKDVSDLHRSIGEQYGQITANRTVELVRRLYYYAEKSELYSGENPARRIARYAEHKRSRYLNANEIAQLFAALRKEKNVDLSDFVQLALFTGARRSDILAMRWETIDLARATWMVPNPKNRSPYVIPLMDKAVAILKRRPKDSAWVFPSRGRTGHLVEMKRGWLQLVKRAKLHDFHIHDLRRTLGSWQAALGASLPVIGKSLGHASAQATEIYARLDLDPVRNSVAAATDAILAASRKKPKALRAAQDRPHGT